MVGWKDPEEIGRRCLQWMLSCTERNASVCTAYSFACFLYLLTFLASAPKLCDVWAEHGDQSSNPLHHWVNCNALLGSLRSFMGVPDICDSSTDNLHCILGRLLLDSDQVSNRSDV